MKRGSVLILKTGSASEVIPECLGDFEQWIASGLGLDDRRGAPGVVVCDVRAGEEVPRPSELAAVVITGSSAMITDEPAWASALCPWLREAAQAGLPILGICFGHQLLAHAAGGQVTENPNGREIGTITVHLAPAAADDPLLGGLPNELRVQATHVETVHRLPAGAVALASSSLDQHQAFRLGERAWGLQFHPEMSAEAVKAYIEARGEVITREGLDAAQLRADACSSPHGARVLRRFAEIAFSCRDEVRQAV